MAVTVGRTEYLEAGLTSWLRVCDGVVVCVQRHRAAVGKAWRHHQVLQRGLHPRAQGTDTPLRTLTPLGHQLASPPIPMSVSYTSCLCGEVDMADSSVLSVA